MAKIKKAFAILVIVLFAAAVCLSVYGRYIEHGWKGIAAFFVTMIITAICSGAIIWALAQFHEDK